MVALNIDNPLIESTLKEKYHSNIKEFTTYLAKLIEKDRFSKQTNDAFKELKQITNGEIEARPIQNLLDEL